MFVWYSRIMFAACLVMAAVLLFSDDTTKALAFVGAAAYFRLDAYLEEIGA
jgi:hypothetical protein